MMKWSGNDYNDNILFVRGTILAILLYLGGILFHELSHWVVLYLLGGHVTKIDWALGSYFMWEGYLANPTVVENLLIGVMGGVGQGVYYLLAYRKATRFVISFVPISFAYGIIEGFLSIEGLIIALHEASLASYPIIIILGNVLFPMAVMVSGFHLLWDMWEWRKLGKPECIIDSEK